MAKNTPQATYSDLHEQRSAAGGRAAASPRRARTEAIRSRAFTPATPETLQGTSRNTSESPEIIGRGPDDDDFLDPRANTRWRVRVGHDYVSGAVGRAIVDLFESTDIDDRGGVVMHLRIIDQGSSMVPWSRNVEGGVELHIGGTAEAAALCTALLQALAVRGTRTILTDSCIEIANEDLDR